MDLSPFELPKVSTEIGQLDKLIESTQNALAVLSAALRREVDHFLDLGRILFHDEDEAFKTIYW